MSTLVFEAVKNRKVKAHDLCVRSGNMAVSHCLTPAHTNYDVSFGCFFPVDPLTVRYRANKGFSGGEWQGARIPQFVTLITLPPGSISISPHGLLPQFNLQQGPDRHQGKQYGAATNIVAKVSQCKNNEIKCQGPCGIVAMASLGGSCLV